tara:strand:+ start:6332 stop:7024 length:693 start_codon:yes stop_codon:yes gene_type:complete
MGYLNNQIITVDAILTNKGRQLLAKGDGSFNITQFALSDDEIDYTLYNPTHPSGSAYYGEAIQNMPLLEAFPDQSQMMKYKLVTLPRGTQVMPIISIGTTTIILPQLATTTITPGTLNYLGGTGTSQSETSGYSFTISDVRVTAINTGFTGAGISNAATIALQTQNANKVITNGTAVSTTVIGTTLTMTGTGNNILFGTSSIIYATLTIVGLDSGARVQAPIQITRTTTS